MLSRVSRGRHFLGHSKDWTTPVHVRVLFPRSQYFSHGPKCFSKPSDEGENRLPGVERLVASFLVKRGTKFDGTKILESLPRLPGDHHLHLNSALFLVTSSLANLFEPGSAFHASAINHIFGRLSSRIEPQSLVAVVDAIPDLRNRSDQESLIFGCEGISVCISQRFNAASLGDRDQDVPLISFHHRKSTNRGSIRETSYMAPLANTLFVNGLQNTMIQQDWIRDIQGTWVENPGSMRTHLKQVDIKVNHGAQDMYSTIMHNKLEQLTEPAIVKSSMGNIVSGLENSVGAAFSASAELEKIVPQFLKARTEAGQRGELRIFALVYPPIPSATGGGDTNNFIADNDSKDKTGRTWLDKRNLHNILKNKGRLYRVTSGGGGWGKKAGLLSLEPMVDVRRRTESEYSMPDFIFSDDGVEMPKSKQLIPRGSLIQFLATFLDPEESRQTVDVAESDLMDPKTIGPRGWNSDAWYNGGLMQILCIGTSALPDVSEYGVQMASQPDHKDAEWQNHKTSNVIFLPNRFGLLSVAPMGISTSFPAPSATTDKFGFGTDLESPDLLLEDEREMSNALDSPHTTLIEAPGTSFISTYRAGGGFYDNVAAKEGRVRPVIQGASRLNKMQYSKPSPSRAGDAKRDVAKAVTAAISSLESGLTEPRKNREERLTRSQNKTTIRSFRKLEKDFPSQVRRIIKIRRPKTGLPGHPYRLQKAQEEYMKSRVRRIDNRRLRISKVESVAQNEVGERAQREREFAYQRANQKEHSEHLQRFAGDEGGSDDLDIVGAQLLDDEYETDETDEKKSPKERHNYHAYSIFGDKRDKAAEQKAIHELMEGLKGD